MAKQTYYFPHDGNARNDDKIIAVRMRHKMEGYGVYFAILERLLEAGDYMSVKDYNVIAFDLHVSAELVKSIIEDFGLFAFSDDNKYFFSQSMIERMKPLENLREQRSIAGKKSAEKRSQKKAKSTTVERPLMNQTTTVGKISTERVDKNKEKEIYKEKVFEVELNGEKKIILSNLYPIMQQMLKDELTIERICMNEKLTKEQLNTHITEFFVLRTNENNQDIQTLNDAQRYFGNWIRNRIEKQTKDKKGAEHVKTIANLHPALQ